MRPYEETSPDYHPPAGALASNHRHFYGLALSAHSECGANLRTAAFFGNPVGAPLSMTRILLPYYRYVGEVDFWQGLRGGDLKLLAPLGNALLELRLAPFEEHGPDLRLALYNWCFTLGEDTPGWQSNLLRQLREDARHLEQQKVVELLQQYIKLNLDESGLRVVLEVLDVLEVFSRPLGSPADGLFGMLRSVLVAADAEPEVFERLEELAAKLLE